MLIYLDAKDLINIFERSHPCSEDQLHQLLQKGGYKLVFSLTTIMEISEPLLHSGAKTNVMWLLNRLEKLPHTFIHEANIPRLELVEAVRAFSLGEEYGVIQPFVNRFDDTVDLNAAPPTKIYLNYPLAETVWDLYTFGELKGLDSYAKKLRPTFAADRALDPKPSLKTNFVKATQLNLNSNKVTGPTEDVATFANWIYSDPSRCPSIRIGYEVWHKMVRNVADEPEDSDMEDFQHIGCLPYVDLMTLDRRMCGYVSQAAATLTLNYSEKVYRNSEQLFNRLDVSI